ncbi:hypothetical protein [Sphaerisporangium fuscum]|uniref:hypothetical protein n=1 Tax=Sphaerisporangium fuscum TaxID=2835868 RepID=UPI001BDD30AE|nr:hypothetical protein [Sphaerisporangium fuscum]
MIKYRQWLAALAPAALLPLLPSTPAGASQTTVHDLKPNVRVLENNTSRCLNDGQTFDTMDRSRDAAPITWTYANKNYRCVEVGYVTVDAYGPCDFYFYVPNGYADGVLAFTWQSGDSRSGTVRRTRFNEDPVNGFQFIGSGTNVKRISFGDDNGQSYPVRLGWGRDQAHGIKQVCPASPRRDSTPDRGLPNGGGR